jgi:NAD(P)-dependent dehydrogenase (short-subunit alcohol dehydrogenase family)
MMARRPESRQTALKGQDHDSQSNSTFYRQGCICHWRYKRHRTGDRDCVCDVRKADDVKTAVDKAVAAFGRIDVAFHNAGVEQRYGVIADITEDDWDRIVAINLRGVLLCMKYVLPVMLKQGHMRQPSLVLSVSPNVLRSIMPNPTFV